MASFKKFLTYTALTAAAVAGGIAIYKKFQGNSVDCDDDFDDLDVDCRNYTSISADNAAEEATEEVSE